MNDLNYKYLYRVAKLFYSLFSVSRTKSANIDITY